jgi:hypothetical protein
MQIRLPGTSAGFCWRALIDANLFQYTGGRAGRFYGFTFRWWQLGVTLYRKP